MLLIVHAFLPSLVTDGTSFNLTCSRKFAKKYYFYDLKSPGNKQHHNGGG